MAVEPDEAAAPATSAVADDEVLSLLQHARELVRIRVAAGSAEPNALYHIDSAITSVAIAANEMDTDGSETAAPGEDPASKHCCCSQETQTFSSPCHSTGTQANPTTASASTGTSASRPVALGMRNVASQENRGS